MPQPTSIKTDNNTVIAVIDISEDLLYFPGHFPGQPILPGYAMIDWVMVLAQTHFNLPISAFEPLQMEVIKFKQMVLPGMQIEMTVELKNNRLYYQVNSEQGEHCSGRIQVNAEA